MRGVRRRAWGDLLPDRGPERAHPTAGAICVGARTELVAYNLYLASGDLTEAKRVAATVRDASVRSLGLQVGDGVQVSMNLVNPALVGPAEAYERVARLAVVERAELVGLVPAHVLARTPKWRWSTLDLSEDRTVESRMARRSGP